MATALINKKLVTIVLIFDHSDPAMLSKVSDTANSAVVNFFW